MNSWNDGRRIPEAGTIAASGNYATGGDPPDLTSIGALGILSTKPPIQGTAWMDGFAAYDYVFSPGSALNANKVKVFQQASGSGTTFTFYGIFPRLP